MGYETPPHRHGALREVLDTLRAARRVILTTHLNADGDGTGSEVAMAAWLKALGAEATIVNPTPFPDVFTFLLPEDGWVVNASSRRAKEICAAADLAVVLDTGEVPRIGRVKPMIQGLTTVVIDHHPPGTRPIQGISFRDPTASATGEMVYDLIRAARGPWPEAVPLGLYVALLTDTGSFRFSNSTPACHRVVADLIERGVDPEAVYSKVYGRAPLRRFRLLRASLETLEADAEAGVTWMEVPHEVVAEIDAQPDDLDGLVDYPRSVEGTEVGLLFRRTTQGDTKISFRATGDVDVNVLAREFDGGGHAKASGALVKGPPSEVIPRVVDAAREAVRRSRDEEHAGRENVR